MNKDKFMAVLWDLRDIHLDIHVNCALQLQMLTYISGKVKIMNIFTVNIL